MRSGSHNFSQLVDGSPIICFVREIMVQFLRRAASNQLQAILVKIQKQAEIKYNYSNLQIEVSQKQHQQFHKLVKGEAEVVQIFPQGYPMHKIFEHQLSKIISTLVQGVNFSIVLYGASGTGKTYAFGGGTSPQPGLAQVFIDSLFPQLQLKRSQFAHGQYKQGGMGISAQVNYKVGARFVEIVNEELTDLLSNQSSFGHNALAVTLDEWEGPSVEGVQWINVASPKALKDLFIRGSRNRTKRSNQFGPLKDKATAVFTIVVEQRILIHGEQSPTLIYSQFNLIELPGCQILQHPEEETAIRQGVKLNQGIFAVNKVTDNLCKNKHGDFTYYQSSQVTKLLTEVIGGNSITYVIFTLKNGDHEGSTQTLQAIQKFKKIRNYPLSNDSRVLGLLRKYRMILLSAQAHGGGGGARSILPRDASQLQQRIADAERQLIQSNMQKMEIYQQKRSLASRSAELKLKYNEAIEAKAEMQTQLINCEEQKLKISKALIELQMEYNQLQDAQHNIQFQKNAKQIQNEAKFIEKGIKQQQATQAIQQYQQKLQDSLQDKKQMEIQYVALRKNYLNMKEDYQKQKNKSEVMQIEIVNLVNENKAMSKNSDSVMRKADGMSGDIYNAQARTQELQKETYKQAQALINAQKEINRLQSELARFQVKEQQYKLDFDSKKIEQEKQIVNLSKQKASNIEDRRMKTPVIKMVQPSLNPIARSIQQQILAPLPAGGDLSEQERQQYNIREKELERKIQQLTADLFSANEIKNESIGERNRMNMSLQQNRTAFRNKLSKIMDDQGMGPGGLSGSAKDQLVRSYVEKENDMVMRIERLEKRLGQVRERFKRFRDYSLQLKHLAEDWAPAGVQLPYILTMDPPIEGPDDMDVKSVIKTRQIEKSIHHQSGNGANNSYELFQKNQIDQLRSKNRRLEEQVEQLQSQALASKNIANTKMSDAQLQKRLLAQIQMLKGLTITNPKPLSRPGTSSAELIEVRRQRDALQEQNKRLKSILYQDSAAPSSGNVKFLKQKIYALQSSVKQLQKQKVELTIRAKMAEEQLVNIEQNLSLATQKYQKQIFDLKRQGAGQAGPASHYSGYK